MDKEKNNDLADSQNQVPAESTKELEQASENTNPPEVLKTEAENQSTIVNPQTNISQSQGRNSLIKQVKDLPRKKLFSIIGGIVGILILAGFVFGFYIPNQPENVWNTGLNRTGKALEIVYEKLSSEESLESLGSSKISGDVKLTGPGIDFSGTISATYDSEKSKGDVRILSGFNGDQEQKLQLDFQSEIRDTNTYPDIFLRLSGVKSYLEGFGLGQLSELDGRWLSINAEYLEENLSRSTENNQNNNLSSEDIREVTKVSIDTIKEYFFTSETDKAVLQLKDFVGEEEVNGLKTNRYTATVNKQNIERFCEAWIDKLYETESFASSTFVDQSDKDKSRENDKKSCKNLVAELSEGEEVEVWIDKKYKLIHKIRINDDKEQGRYLDIGQIYSGGDDLTIFIEFNDDQNKTTGKLEITTNMKSYESSINLDINSSLVNAQVNLEIKPNQEEIELENPENALPIEELINGFTGNTQTPKQTTQ